MKLFLKINASLALFISALSLTSCSVGVVAPVAVVRRPITVEYVNPEWAPPIYQGARYYYMPDIETYYDLSNRNFVYYNSGQWLNSPTLPSMYADYDLYSGFAVTLSANAYQPWLRHQYYITNYPRYYYQNVYVGTEYRYVRGFNENERKPVFYRNEERARVDEARERQRNTVPQNRAVYDSRRNDRPVEPTRFGDAHNTLPENNRSNTNVIINNTNSGTNSNANNNRVMPPSTPSTPPTLSTPSTPSHPMDRTPVGSGYSTAPHRNNNNGRNMSEPVRGNQNTRVMKPAQQQIKPANNEKNLKREKE